MYFSALMHRFISFIIRWVPRPVLQRLAGSGLVLISWLYRGNAVQCPVCGGTYRRFLSYGRQRLRLSEAALERHRLIWLYLKERTDFFTKPHQVLHIAPELCFIRPFERQHGKLYITADLESPWAKIKMDVQHMPFADNQFNVVLCNHVLEHVENDIQALQEIKRVLRPGGYAILQVPFYHPVPEKTLEDQSIVRPADREKLYGQADHVRRYGKDYLNRIGQAGLKAREVAFAEELGPDVCRRHGLVLTEKIYLAQK